MYKIILSFGYSLSIWFMMNYRYNLSLMGKGMNLCLIYFILGFNFCLEIFLLSFCFCNFFIF